MFDPRAALRAPRQRLAVELHGEVGGSGELLHFANCAKWGKLACYFSTLRTQLEGHWADQKVVESLLTRHRAKLEEFGLTLHSGRHDVWAFLSELEGKEEGFVKWLEDFAEILAQEAERLPRRLED